MKKMGRAPSRTVKEKLCGTILNMHLKWHKNVLVQSGYNGWRVEPNGTREQIQE